MLSLNKIYSPKQIEVLKACRSSDWFMLINHGAKRSGKTQVDNDLFIQELMRVRGIANSLGIDVPQYILAGYSLGNIQDNILTELSNKYGFEFKFDKYNNFILFGVKVVQTSHGSISGLGRIRGMTSFGAYINEASLANQGVFDEIKARCSGPGARIIADTNPDHPEHWLLKDYIESKAGGIVSFHFQLDDNTFLDERYIREIKETTPKGMFYDRGIQGLWVSGEGVVYPAFDRNVHVITAEQAKRIIFDRYLAGVDWGWEHFGAIVTIGVKGDSYYVIEEHAAQHKYIGEWVQIAKDIIRRYGNIPFYCDPARTEHIAAFQKAGINAYLANNRVLSGIEEVATLMERQQFFIVYEQCPRFREEIYKYVWKKNTGEPLKENDDVLCAIRYGIHSDKTVSTIQSPEERMKKAKKIRGML
ncbi:PBSX family phage terminase large subunit [Sporofaciens musculi]|uniref:PBSX family phage terminase large subunit n=1 Tax=Sporofaciens musculi TaxID=2681861 RepID=UPI00259CA51F|nr:PBSX family phage terminase large subunit [Sporofaciens musculi]